MKPDTQAIIEASRVKTREMWLARRDREDQAGKTGRVIELRRLREDQIMASWQTGEPLPTIEQTLREVA